MEDPISLDILGMLSRSSPTSNSPCISRIPNFFRQVNEKAYEPKVIAIGPYHQGKDHLKAMEERKIGVLRLILEEREENDVSKYVMKMKELEEKARECYEKPVSLGSHDFIKMLLLDGCFIVQLIRLFLNKNSATYKGNWVFCYSKRCFSTLLQDLLFVENQLPFFVLWELFAMIETEANAATFIETIFDMFHNKPPGKGRPKEELKPISLEFKHLLDFTYHHCFHPSTSKMTGYGKERHGGMEFIRCATELQEAGIEFKKIEGNSMFDIRFENKTLYIPQLLIEDRTEPFLRNLIAYEQLLVSGRDLKHATDYIMFMDCLINSPKDVEILCQNKIIKNMLGDDKAVADLINSLGIHVMCSKQFYYALLFNKVNQHCSNHWNKWMANLKHNYFNGPWALISFLAAALLLLLTLLQTIFSVLSYVK